MNFATIVRNRFSLPLAHYLINAEESDRFLVSYPRSGSTWLRAILCNILMPEANGDPEIFNRVIPGVSLRRLPLIYKSSRPRLIQTHTWFRSDIPKAVYLLRDGRDVLVSSYHYQVTRQGLGDSISFSTWFEHYLKGYYGQRWDHNVESWLITGVDQMADNLIVIKFEELRSNTQESIRSIARFLNVSGDEKRIAEAINGASIKKARQWERKYLGEIRNPNASFYRGGRIGQYTEYFSDEMMDRFLRVSYRAMRLGGYQ